MNETQNENDEGQVIPIPMTTRWGGEWQRIDGGPMKRPHEVERFVWKPVRWVCGHMVVPTIEEKVIMDLTENGTKSGTLWTKDDVWSLKNDYVRAGILICTCPECGRADQIHFEDVAILEEGTGPPESEFAEFFSKRNGKRPFESRNPDNPWTMSEKERWVCGHGVKPVFTEEVLYLQSFPLVWDGKRSGFDTHNKILVRGGVVTGICPRCRRSDEAADLLFVKVIHHWKDEYGVPGIDGGPSLRECFQNLILTGNRRGDFYQEIDHVIQIMAIEGDDGEWRYGRVVVDGDWFRLQLPVVEEHRQKIAETIEPEREATNG